MGGEEGDDMRERNGKGRVQGVGGRYEGEDDGRGRMVGGGRWWEGGDGGDYCGSNSLPIIDCIECELSNCLLCLATLVRVPEHDLPPSNVHGYNPVGRGEGWRG